MSKPSEVQKILAKLIAERDILDRVIATIQLAASAGTQPEPKRAPKAIRLSSEDESRASLLKGMK